MTPNQQLAIVLFGWLAIANAWCTVRLWRRVVALESARHD